MSKQEGVEWRNDYRCYDDRKKEKCIVSLADTNAVDRESDLVMTHCTFHGIDERTCVFSLTERDDCKGFGVEMHNVMVVPNSYPCFPGMPKWAVWLLSRVFRCIGAKDPNTLAA